MARRRKDRPDEQVSVCGREVSITYQRDLDDCDGCFYPDEAEIHVDLEASRDPDQILFHELLHAALAFSGVSDLLTESSEEALVSCLEQNIFPLVRLKAREKV